MEALETLLLLAEDFRDPLLPLWAMELTAKILLYAWLFALGGTVGSFLNVVIYRLPRGKNLAIPGSACPHCGHPIRLSDNVPILSWLALRGRCRDCGGSISPRYVLVELLVATTFLLVLAGELFLPTGSLGFATRRLLTPYDGPSFWCQYGLHLLLAVTAYAAVLIASDGFNVPPRLYGPALLAGLVLPLLWPELRSVPALRGLGPGWPAGLVDGLLGTLAGGLIGVVMGMAAWVWMGQGEAPLPRLRFGLLGATVGLVFGWQQALWLTPILLAISALAISAWTSKPATEVVVKELTTQQAAPADIAADVAAATAALPLSAAITEEVHLVSPPTEPTEPS